MSACYCMHHALAIARQPLPTWDGALKQLPDACDRDCGEPRSCRRRNSDYLRVQWQMAKRRDAIAARKPAAP